MAAWLTGLPSARTSRAHAGALAARRVLGLNEPERPRGTLRLFLTAAWIAATDVGPAGAAIDWVTKYRSPATQIAWLLAGSAQSATWPPEWMMAGSGWLCRLARKTARVWSRPLPDPGRLGSVTSGGTRTVAAHRSGTPVGTWVISSAPGSAQFGCPPRKTASAALIAGMWPSVLVGSRIQLSRVVGAAGRGSDLR